jgi:hypothetical protein
MMMVITPDSTSKKQIVEMANPPLKPSMPKIDGAKMPNIASSVMPIQTVRVCSGGLFFILACIVALPVIQMQPNMQNWNGRLLLFFLDVVNPA